MNPIRHYVRYRFEGKTGSALLEEGLVFPIHGDCFADGGKTGEVFRLEEVELLCPCVPSKILAVGLNFRSHLGNRPLPEKPELFWKPVSALLDPGAAIRIPPEAKTVHSEGELVLVIGRRAHRVSREEAEACIFGYTCGNDVSERDWQRNDLQWWRAKGADTFAPLGPAIAIGLDWRKSRLETRINGTVQQSQVLSDLIFDPAEIVSHASRAVTLLPGDVIYTGTPGTTGAIRPGDVVEVEIEGVGCLRNPVAAGGAEGRPGGAS